MDSICITLIVEPLNLEDLFRQGDCEIMSPTIRDEVLNYLDMGFLIPHLIMEATDIYHHRGFRDKDWYALMEYILSDFTAHQYEWIGDIITNTAYDMRTEDSSVPGTNGVLHQPMELEPGTVYLYEQVSRLIRVPIDQLKPWADLLDSVYNSAAQGEFLSLIERHIRDGNIIHGFAHELEGYIFCLESAYLNLFERDLFEKVNVILQHYLDAIQHQVMPFVPSLPPDTLGNLTPMLYANGTANVIVWR